ncbi:hypothetical protein GCM10010984_19810 [Chishuiella changwenlii]|uniref:META domain-containing protein n=1 Tax=Chishuiella changwenlii TaxID=1434701 RepID=A0ABQ1TVH1_9FLAO|nr:hypothetical protein [Chishuiella changwenlii]GGF02334.1 hypothetical protein GCM10010984_19810 [Chishuiella changwenlii]
MKWIYKVFLGILFFSLGSCLPSKVTSEPKGEMGELKEFSGKWSVNNQSDYIIFEDATQKMVLKTSCGIITGNYTRMKQAIIFNQLKQLNSDCEIPQELMKSLQKTVYFKLNSSNSITFYDDTHQEKMKLNIVK